MKLQREDFKEGDEIFIVVSNPDKIMPLKMYKGICSPVLGNSISDYVPVQYDKNGGGAPHFSSLDKTKEDAIQRYKDNLTEQYNKITEKYNKLLNKY